MEGTMRRYISRTIRILMVVAALTPPRGPASAQTPLESSSEARFQLDLHVSDQALTPLAAAGLVAERRHARPRQGLQPARDFR